MPRDQRIVRADRRALRGEQGAHRAGVARILSAEFQHAESQHVDKCDIARGTLAFECAVVEFVQDDGGDEDIRGRVKSRTAREMAV